MYKNLFLTIFTVNIFVYGNVDDTYITTDEEYATPVNCKDFCSENVRDKRVTDPPVRSKIVDVMMRTPSLQMNPNEPDVFGFLRDRYDLPKGMYF